MRKSKLTVKTTSLFKKDYKQAIKRGWKIEMLENNADDGENQSKAIYQ